MNDFYTFIVGSSLNTTTGVYNQDQRLIQTLETFHSIRKRVPNACIVFVDTENPPVTARQRNLISAWADHYIEHEAGLLEKVSKDQFGILAKSIGEYSLYDRAFNYIKQHGLAGKRIFKISGRYQLAESFTIRDYENPVFLGSYVFRHRSMFIQRSAEEGGEAFYTDFLETRLWSMCSSLLDEFHTQLPDFLSYTIKNRRGIEMAMWSLLRPDKVFVVPQVHLEGHIAEHGTEILD